MSGMWSMISTLSEQYRWAAQLAVSPVPGAGGAVICGMGGSGISGDLAAAAEPEAFIAVSKAYSLPGWAADVRPLVIPVSYSGNTEETLSATRQALDRGLPVAAVSGGGVLADLAAEHAFPLVRLPLGLQPRAALGYLTGAVLRVLEGAGLVPEQSAALTEAAGIIDELLGKERDGAGWGLAEDLAEGLAGRISLIYGSEGLVGPAAQRWKTQINENGKRPAFWATLSELDHNEIVGWPALASLTRRALGIVLLRDRDEHPQIERRFALTSGLISPSVPIIGEVWSQGESRLARLASLSLIGDLVSVFLAEQEGVDPVEVEVIEKLKILLKE